MTRVQVADPVLQAKLDAAIAEHEAKKEATAPPEVNEHPRYVFSRDTAGRDIEEQVRVRNGMDEDTPGGVIKEKIGRAYWVEVHGQLLIVHEPDDSWDP